MIFGHKAEAKFYQKENSNEPTGSQPLSREDAAREAVFKYQTEGTRSALQQKDVGFFLSVDEDNPTDALLARFAGRRPPVKKASESVSKKSAAVCLPGLSPLQDESIAESHIRANVPDQKNFDKFLKRDLEQYFKDTKKKILTSNMNSYGRYRHKAASHILSFMLGSQSAMKVPLMKALFASHLSRRNGFDVTDFVSKADLTFANDVGPNISQSCS